MIAATWLALAEEERDPLFLILPEAKELIWGAVSFAVLAFLIWWKVGPKLAETLAARQAAVTSRLEEAEKAKADAEGLLNDYRQQLAGAKSEANRIIEESRQSAEQLRQELMARSQAEAERIAARARAEVAAERERASTELKREVATLSVQLAGKVVEKNLDTETQRALVESYLADLDGIRR